VNLIAASTAQRVGIAVAVVISIGWAIYFFSTARRTYAPGSEMELAPNRKRYYEDEGLEGPRLTKYLWWAFALMAITAVGLPVYWLREPTRQAGAGLDRGTEWFEEESVERGKWAFQVSPGDPPAPEQPHYGCETCHGPEGVGGVANYTLSDESNPEAPPRQVQWVAPALNTVMLKYRPEEVHNIIEYGRANTPMPPWGVEGGGALNDQQIEDLVAYLQSIQLDVAEVKQQNLEQYGTDGAALFDSQCARCHTMGWSYGEPGVAGGGAFGPPINGGSTIEQFPDPETQFEWVAKTGEYGEPYGVRGVGHSIMPHFEEILSTEQIQAIVDYERGLPAAPPQPPEGAPLGPPGANPPPPAPPVGVPPPE
jgi:mono/diheme cytochrome c family protein